MADDPELLWHDGHGRGAGLMVVLHGFAEHPVSALMLGSMLDPERRFRVCAPMSPLTAGSHKRSFYRSESRMAPDPDSFAAAVSHVDRAIDAACEQAAVDRSAVVLVGFSQGGGLAMAVNYRRSVSAAVAAVVVFSSRFYPPELGDWDFAAASGTRMFAAHGRADRLSPFDEMRDFLAPLDGHGIDVTWSEHRYGHILDADSVGAASRWVYSHDS